MTAASKLSPRDTRRARDLAEWVESASPGDGMDLEWAKGEARHLLLALAPRKRVARDVGPSVAHHEKARRVEEREVSAETAAAYKAVARRDRRCTVQLPESIMGPCSGRLTIDHQWGRGKEPTKTENCRRLCETHHRLKTDNKPSRLAWLYDYAEHCLGLAGLGREYMDEVDRAQNAAQLEKAQHPEARSPRGGRQEGRTG
jgi:hypothetical protein